MSRHIIIGQSTNINVFSWLLFFFKLREREREWYTKFGYKAEIAPKVTYLIFRRGSTRESFFFHGLIDFILFFYTGLKNLGSLVSQIFFCLLPGVNGYGSVCHEPFPIINISSRFFRWLGEGCHFRFRAPANHLASLSFSLPVSSDLRLLSTNTCWYPLCDLHSFLTVTFLTGCHCSFQREDSINLISIVSVGYHVTLTSRWLFPEEQKGCCKGSRGTAKLL